MMKLIKLQCQNRSMPIGIGAQPYFSWVLESDDSEVIQVTYHIVVKEAQAVVWDSGLVHSPKSAYVEYAGEALKSCTSYTWQVTVQDNHQNTSTEASVFETGILSPRDWKARWVISPLYKKPVKKVKPAVQFRKAFQLERRVIRARVYATCHGIYRLSVNGARPDDREMAPEFTVYEKSLCVQAYDVTSLLQTGDNVLGMEVADGWYRGGTTKQTYPGWDPSLACLWQLVVTYEDDTQEIICSDADIKVGTGAITSSDLFHGESYDDNLAQKGWDTPDFNASSWQQAELGSFGYEALIPQEGEPVRPVLILPVKKIITTPKGETVLDFGQNMAGRLRAAINLPKGATATFEHSETLDKEGNYFNNIQGINQKDSFTSSGRPALFEPAFTFHGFRYVRVTGIPQVHKEDFTAVVLSTDEAWISTFECSDARINRLVENTRWSQRSNMLSVPTDCPQREKMGWTGDMTVYARTAFMNQNLTGLVTRWLESVAYVQLPDGQVPNVAPWPDFYKMVSKLTNVLLGGSFKDIGSSGWGDASAAVPWELYVATGNTAILRKQYESMKAWVEYMRRQAAAKRPKKGALPEDMEQYLWDTGFHFGEWLIPSATKHGSMSAAVRKSAKAGRYYIAPVYFYTSCRTLADTAHILGKVEDAKAYGELAVKIKAAYQASMVLPDGRLKIDVQGAYALALGAGLIPEHLRKKAAARLAKLIHQNDDRLDTGFLPTPFLLDALSDNGYASLAYTLLRQDQRPSWMFEVEKGATTIWENWNCEDAKGNVQTISMNHYAFGCVADWIYRKIGGIVRTGVGYSEFRIQPQPDSGLAWGKQSYNSPNGRIVSEWRQENGRFYLHAEIPCNTRAVIILPDGQTYPVGSGAYDYSCDIL
ncbi:MAG TPA: family 78 glycoside hydrolase catalytic domain [Clostridiales bacterium]|nr:family 78 glycoside hydrolase catalytic domain [Clostridiales bacterium]